MAPVAENLRATKAEEQLGAAGREPAAGQPREENLAEVKAEEKSKYFRTSTTQIFKNYEKDITSNCFCPRGLHVLLSALSHDRGRI